MESAFNAASGENGNIDDFVNSCLSVFDGTERTEALTKLKDVFAKSSRRVNTLITEHAKEAVSQELSTSDGDIFLELPDAQFFEPRGRFKVQVSTLGLHLTGKSAACFVPWNKITHTAAVPASQTTKKEGEDYLCMRIEPGSVQYNGKELKSLLWNMNKSLGKPIKVTHNDFNIGGTESDVVTSLVSHLRGIKVTQPRTDLFTTVSQTAAKDAKSFLRCYKGTQEGAIYPLECGVVFVKPILFIPAEEIASITAGRGGGSGQTRYVDLKLELADDSEYEFTNIEREELPALQGYVKGFLEVRKLENEKAAQIVKAEKLAKGESVSDDSDSDEDDDDFDPDASDSENFGSSDDDSSDDSGDDSSDDSYASEGDLNGSDDDSANQKINNENSSKQPTVDDVRKDKKKKSKKGSPNKSIKKTSTPLYRDEEDVDALMRAAYQSSKIKREHDEVTSTEDAAAQIEGSETKRQRVEDDIKLE